MKRKLHLFDYIIISAGLISFVVAMYTMLEMPTLIIPPWMLVIMYGCILLLIAFALGALVRSITKSKVHLLTATSTIIMIVCIFFYISQFKPIYKIYLAANFKGEVKLFRSTLNKNMLSLSEYGVGYITDNEYRNGFRPIVYQNGRDITKECKNIVRGSLASAGFDGKSVGPLSYFGFTIGDKTNDTLWTDLGKVIDLNIVDTSIIMK